MKESKKIDFKTTMNEQSKDIVGYFTLDSMKIFGKRRFTDVVVFKEKILFYEPMQDEVVASVTGLDINWT